MGDIEQLIRALRMIDDDLRWYRVAGGAVSSDDLRAIITKIVRRLNSVRHITHPSSANPAEPLPPLDNDF